jgi:hypothetical protein
MVPPLSGCPEPLAELSSQSINHAVVHDLAPRRLKDVREGQRPLLRVERTNDRHELFPELCVSRSQNASPQANSPANLPSST